MKVSNIRFGFATNSSSLHSIVYRNDMKGPVRDHYVRNEFGSGNFTLQSTLAKSNYLSQLLYSTLNREIGEELALDVVEDLFGADAANFVGDGYLDHQSFMALPANLETRHTSIHFFKELLEYYLRSDIVIVGGGDEDTELKYADIRHPHILPVDVTNDFVCRKDGEWWLLHSRRTGTKIRLSFNDNAPEYVKATSPELVDLKITNQCIMGCDYCYQDSDINGQHATYQNVFRILRDLKSAGVLEVALGGGEPTRHPQFTNIIRDVYQNHMLVNFTTRDLDWVNNSRIVRDVEKYVSRFGVSICTQHDLAEAFHVIPESLHPKIYFHYVIGTGNLEPILQDDSVIRYLDNPHPIILLGFKKVGRGASYTHYGNSDKDWIKWVKNSHAIVGIDTALANQFKEQVAENFDKSLVQYEEGKFSMYIDAVRMEMAPCSYAPRYEHDFDAYEPYTQDTVIQKVFRRY